MNEPSLENLSIDQLVARHAAIGIEHDKAIDMDNHAKFKRIIRRLFDEKTEIENELKRRPGDQRRSLMALYNHPNMQVRLNAAKATLAVAPEAARRVVEAIAETQYPQAGDAGMCLWALDKGIFVPK